MRRAWCVLAGKPRGGCPVCSYVFRRVEGPAQHVPEANRRPLENGAVHAAQEAPAKRPTGSAAASAMTSAASGSHSAADIKVLQNFSKPTT